MSVGVWAAAEAAAFHAPMHGEFARGGSGGIVALRIDGPADAEAAVSRLARELGREQRFAVLVEGPTDLPDLHRMLALAPGARRHLRRMRPALGAWCAGVAHVVGRVPEAARPAEVVWGCRTTAAAGRDAAEAWLRARLAA